MSGKFETLSRAGRLAKIRQHVDGGHPAEGTWVRWLLGISVERASGSSPAASAAPFASLGREDRLACLHAQADEATIPSPWVGWLLGELSRADAEPHAPRPGM